MIGIYSYTVVLTYLSLLSAGAGIIISLSGGGHPYWGCIFLLFCGLCDAFDGKVARMKKDRTEIEKNYGIQIDSLSDLVAFGVLPACIGVAMMRSSTYMKGLSASLQTWQFNVLYVAICAVLVLYILAALIRLGYFNVTEEERQKTEGGVRKFYTGLPVTSAALIFPLVLLVQYFVPADITLLYPVVVLVTGFLFLSKLQVRKPGMKGIYIMIAVGAVEFILLLVRHMMRG